MNEYFRDLVLALLGDTEAAARLIARRLDRLTARTGPEVAP